MKRLLPAALAVLVLALLALHVRIQPPEHARVIRRGEALRVVTGRIAFAPLYLGRGCTVPVERDALLFRDSVEARTEAGEPFETEATIRYRLPEALPASWPAGTWCESLRAVVEETARTWASSTPRRALLADPRAAGWTGSGQLTAALTAAGVMVADASLRPRLPEDLLSTRPVPEIEAAAAAGSRRGGVRALSPGARALLP